MPELSLDDVMLAYDDPGEPSLPAVVLLHGLSLARSTWTRVAHALAGRWRVLALDQRGHGASGHAPGTYDLSHYGPDTVIFCERVVREPAVLVGHSLGGVIAAYVARTRPDLVRAIFLEDPPLFRDERDTEPSAVSAAFPLARQVLREMRERNAPVGEYEAMMRAAPALNRRGSMTDVLGHEGATALGRAFSSVDPEVFTPAIEGTLLAGAEPSKPLSCPVRVLRANSELGPAFTSEDEARFLRTNPHATVELMTGASHAIHDEQPGRFTSELVRFLEAI